MRALQASLLVCVASSASAGTNEVMFGTATRALRAPSADALTSDALTGGQLGYARALEVALPYDLVLWVDAQLEWGNAKGSLFQSTATDVTSIAPVIGARLVYEPHRRIAVSGRLGLGAAHESLSLTPSSGPEVSDGAWAAVASATLAVDVRLLVGPRFDFGLRGQLGYVVASRVALTPHRDGPDDGTLTLPVMDEPIGHLDLGGPTAALSVIGDF
jgi:hypothetical protein